MQNIALVVAYDGTNYWGWQKTDQFPSIEESLQNVLEQILQHPVMLQAAGRTDRGVHAEGQVVNFFTEKNLNLEKLQYSINCLLPDDIRVREVILKEFDFHPTLSAIKKEYHYYTANSPVLLPFKRNYLWHYPEPLNIDLIKKAATCCIGTHDFRAFRNFRKDLKENDTKRSLLSLEVTFDKDILCFKMIADNFLYKMARNIAGALVYVGAKKLSLDQLQKLLQGQKRADGAITAPAQGLFLHKVYY